MTQPLLAGIVTDLGRKRVGQAMGLSVFALFFGFRLGSLLFGEASRHGFATALGIVSTAQVVAGLAGLGLFCGEIASHGTPGGEVELAIPAHSLGCRDQNFF